MGHTLYANSADPDQTPQNAAFDQGLHCLLAENSIKIYPPSLKTELIMVEIPFDINGLMDWKFRGLMAVI